MEPDRPTTTSTDDINDGVGTYDVIVLAEHTVSAHDAHVVWGLHSEIGDEVIYHVLIPEEDAAARLEATVGTLGAGELIAAPVLLEQEHLDAVRAEFREAAATHLRESLDALRAEGATVHGRIVTQHPLEALEFAAKECDVREVIVLTSPHVVAEFFHVDWASQARRRLGVPVLHLLEHH